MSVTIYNGTAIELVDTDSDSVQLVGGLPNPIESGFVATPEIGGERSWVWTE